MRIAQPSARVFAGTGLASMALDKVIAPLLRVPILAGLKPLQLSEIARSAERIAFRRGNAITTAGALGDGAYLIVSGDAVRMPNTSSEPPQPVEPGSLIGELAMLVDHVYGVTVMAETRVHCLKITRAALYEQMQADPSLADYFADVLRERLAHIAAEMRRIDRFLASPDEGKETILRPLAEPAMSFVLPSAADMRA